MCRKNFYGDTAIKTDITGAINLAHAACTDGRLDLIRPEHCARRKWHREPAGLYVYKLADAPEIVPIAGGEIRSVRNNKSCRLSAFTEMLHTRSLDSGLSLALIGNGPIIGDFPMQRRAVGNHLGEPRVDEGAGEIKRCCSGITKD